jgi:hypothetical protein
MTTIREFLGLQYYTSPLDDFLAAFDESHRTLSASQRKEIEKYRRIYNLRDHTHAATETDKLWEKF